jgi:hypothetical protein
MIHFRIESANDSAPERKDKAANTNLTPERRSGAFFLFR